MPNIRSPSYDDDTALAIAIALSKEEAATQSIRSAESPGSSRPDEPGDNLVRQKSQVVEDSALDQELEQRVQGVARRAHIPKQNSKDWSYQPQDSQEDRARLLSNLCMYGLTERDVKGDGNCQFRALSDQLFRTPHMHMEVRQMAVRQLQARPELYQGFADDEFMHYCAQMSQPGAWGDHISLQAAADAFGLRIFIISSYELACVIEIKPNGGWRSERILYLSFWHEVHYASVYPAADPPRNLASDKLLGSRKLYNLFRGSPPANKGILTLRPAVL